MDTNLTGFKQTNFKNVVVGDTIIVNGSNDTWPVRGKVTKICRLIGKGLLKTENDGSFEFFSSESIFILS